MVSSVLYVAAEALSVLVELFGWIFRLVLVLSRAGIAELLKTVSGLNLVSNGWQTNVGLESLTNCGLVLLTGQ